MIVREIKENPDKILSSFDWFNDYDDTRNYCMRISRPDLVTRLEDGFKVWMKKQSEDFLKRVQKKT